MKGDNNRAAKVKEVNPNSCSMRPSFFHIEINATMANASKALEEIKLIGFTKLLKGIPSNISKIKGASKTFKGKVTSLKNRTGSNAAIKAKGKAMDATVFRPIMG